MTKNEYLVGLPLRIFQMGSGRWCVKFFYGSPRFIKEEEVPRWTELKKKKWATQQFWDAMPLGRLPDAVLARALGVSYERVHHARWSRGIPIMDDPNFGFNPKRRDKAV